MDIIHRDIKPGWFFVLLFKLKIKENILLSSKEDFTNLKVADYGLSACFFNSD